MKVTLNWLKEYVDFDWSPEVLAERLTMLGIEVEGVEKKSGEFEKIVVAEVLASEKHPNADKLSVCRVADGEGERQIVCGAKNYKVGDKVPLALPGCTLPTRPGESPFTIKVSKMRGVESQGMMCSARELGVAEDAEGLMILSETARVGQGLAEYLGRAGSDVIYDLEITPNRPDLNSVMGIAREIAALTGNPLRTPIVGEHPVADPMDAVVRIDIQEPELCPRYVARIVRGVKVGPSPEWLRSRLELVGMRSINNVVDVTNFVMLETGQPLHAFDYHLLEQEGDGKRTVLVRRAANAEKFVTLDGQERSLSDQALLIADRQKGIALAGIMGGQNTEIQDSTRDVLIESANFRPQNIRATSKKLELRTDSSYRFERGADIGICDWASRRAAVLIQQLAGGEILGSPVDAYPAPRKAVSVSLRTRKTEEVLGIPMSAGEQRRYLQSLGLEVEESSSGAEFSVFIPTFRVDLKREIDLIEEIARLHGVDRIPATAPRGAVGSHPFDAVYDDYVTVRAILAAAGMSEAQGQTLVSDQTLQSLNGRDALDQVLRLENPLSSDMNVLRPSLLPGLLEALKHNAHHQNGDVRLFELGRVFRGGAGETREERGLAMVMTGRRAEPFWTGTDRDAKVDAFDLKGVLEEFFEKLGIRGVQWVADAAVEGPYLQSASVVVGKQPAGRLGQLNPALARKYDLRDPVFMAEVNLDFLLSRRNQSKSLKGLAAFPSVRRDVAMILPEGTSHDAVIGLIRRTKPQNLESADVFDVFRGKGVPEGHKSLAYAFIYRHGERTLTEAEVNSTHEKLVERFKAELKAEIR